MPKLDTYITTTLGWNITIYERKWKDGGGEHTSKDGDSGRNDFLFGTHIGARYYFTPNIGVFLELGGYAPHYAALGVGFKF